MAVAALATVGLLVSGWALWPRGGEGSVPAGSGPSVGRLDASDRPGGASPDGSGVEPGETIPRARATLPSPAADLAGAARLRAPTIGLDVPVRPVGVARDRQMALPPDPTVLGWYRYGPAPGSGGGSVVLAGHLDSRRYGLGPLVRLREVELGDRIEVTRDDGTRRAYLVRSLRRYDRQALPAEIFSRVGRERLRIVTCGGAYLPDRGGYQLNLVVTAVPARM